MRTARFPALALLAALLLTPVAQADEDPVGFVQFVEDPTSTCVSRNGTQIQVRSTHPKRTIRVWLDRWHMGAPTADRSRTELRPGAEPEPLGCSRSTTGAQEWRIVRAAFVD